MSDGSKAPRIAISFGNSSSSKNNKKPSRPDPPSSLGKRSRTNALNNFDSDSEGDRDHGRGRHEVITEIGGDSDRKREKKPRELVIGKQSNRDWKAELRGRRGGKNLLPAEVQAQREQEQNGAQQEAEREPADAGREIQWGLTVKKRKTSEGDATPTNQGETVNNDGQGDRSPKEKRAPRTADEDAMDALLGNKRQEEEDVVIQATEQDAYLSDIKRVGQDATLADYDAIPDGEFGAALLRGMGWDGKMRGPKKKQPTERRQNQLGLGAKKLEGAEDLGQWNHGGKKKSSRPRLDEYRREEEKKRSERKERRGESYRDERDRERDRDRDRDRHGGSHRDRERERDRDRDRDYYSSRHRSGDSRR
ncbi:DExH-box splicing factor binding site-domain-containing protein [Colletotrichum godetiae]|uniref:Pre-mRNA-splicing factor n=1 Tax=Colletotrichum godetiae TaxID=1209918 RepID=A0AAJ0AGY3_9PEZI|nr:DExH-box splicing factor binding site-domain-containing protein [Colletotrichum godetiae]KAK1671506.1 DExH-box splicing factor binding site-domain-containing protein [Colletotrichum godetiae]